MELKYINILLNIDEIYQPKVKYVFNTLSQILGLKPKYFTGLSSQQIHIYYGKRSEEEYPIHIFLPAGKNILHLVKSLPVVPTITPHLSSIVLASQTFHLWIGTANFWKIQ
jgi:hypothetical protein